MGIKHELIKVRERQVKLSEGAGGIHGVNLEGWGARGSLRSREGYLGGLNPTSNYPSPPRQMASTPLHNSTPAPQRAPHLPPPARRLVLNEVFGWENVPHILLSFRPNKGLIAVKLHLNRRLFILSNAISSVKNKRGGPRRRSHLPLRPQTANWF